MVIILKNDKRINLEWNLLCVEYVEEYPGGLKQLQKDMKLKINVIKSMNYLIAAIIRGNYSEILTREESLKLVKFEDYDKIMNFIEKECDLLNDYKKKETSYPPKMKKKKNRR